VPADRFLRLVVGQQGIDLAVALEEPGGAVLVEGDRPIGPFDSELLLAVSRVAGVHALVVRGLAEGTARGSYWMRVDVLRAAGDRDLRAAETFRRAAAAKSLTGAERLERWREVAASWHDLGEPALEGDALSVLGWSADHRLDRRQAAEFHRAAIVAYQRAGERRQEMMRRADRGAALLNLVEPPAAIAEFQAALDLARAEGDPEIQARALQGIARCYLSQGELQRPLDLLEQARALWPPGDGEILRANRANTLHDLGVLYARYLGERERGRAWLRAALDAWPERRHRQRAFTLNQLGQVAWEEGRPAEAKRRYEESLAALGDDDPCLGAVVAARLSVVEGAAGDRPAAEARIATATAAAGEPACRVAEPTIQLLAAHLAEQQHDWPQAERRFERCRALFAERGDRSGETASLAGLARSRRALGDSQGALAASGRALTIVTGVRPTLLREDLRTSFFAGAQDLFDLHIALLLDRGRAGEAWVTAERAREQALRDLLAEAGTQVHERADDLLDRGRSLQGRLNALDQKRFASTGGDVTGAAETRREIDAVVDEMEGLRGEIRRRGADDLLDPGPIAPAALQRELDGDTLLLEFRLGAEASALWAVDRSSITAYRLPPRRELEGLAREGSRWLRSLQWPGAAPPPLCELSRRLLARVASALRNRPLALVPDGALESLSFAALPDPTSPCAGAAPLMAAHEISYLPSVAVLATQRRLLAGRRPAAGWLAVVADPVYEPGDPRLASAAGDALPAAQTRGRFAFHRLLNAGPEATAILADLPAGKTYRADGVDARKKAVLAGSLAGYRVVHFATHGRLEPDRPQLSFLALSRFDGEGREVDGAGALYAHEIYGLDLPAELVVLSACDTALGREVRGEGLVSGLPRAFLHAGAARVLVSLWEVGDPSTAELMTVFYRALIGRGLPPARALQVAQTALWRAGRPPAQWAPFVLQGDPRPLPAFTP
jgi:CHAT domain-containing protein/tetratricopeptide (TPR) repeat protein